MLSLFQTFLMVVSAILIAGADTLIKKVSDSNATGWQIVSSPVMIVACILYFIQILIAVYIFRNGGELAIYANLYIIFYSILTVAAGVLIFRESIGLMQGIGIVFAITGAVFINIK